MTINTTANPGFSLDQQARLSKINQLEINVDNNKNAKLNNNSKQNYDRAYRKIANEKLLLGDAKGALSTASKISSGTLLGIILQCNDPDLIEKVIQDWPGDERDTYCAYRKIVATRLSLNDCAGALKTALKASKKLGLYHDLFSDIINQCNDPMLMEKAADKMLHSKEKINQYVYIDAYQHVIYAHLVNKNLSAAIRMVEKCEIANIYIGTSTENNPFVEFIQETDDLEMAESVANLLSEWDYKESKEAYQMIMQKKTDSVKNKEITMRIKKQCEKENAEAEEAQRNCEAAFFGIAKMAAIIALGTLITFIPHITNNKFN